MTDKLQEQFDRDYDAQISENNRLKAELKKWKHWWNEEAVKLEKANEILKVACKQCSEDNFGECQNDCCLNDLTKLFASKNSNKPEVKK